jgi:cytochrome b subunit of formate dehydrogenase
VDESKSQEQPTQDELARQIRYDDGKSLAYTALALAGISFFVCGLLLAPIALVLSILSVSKAQTWMGILALALSGIYVSFMILRFAGIF